MLFVDVRAVLLCQCSVLCAAVSMSAGLLREVTLLARKRVGRFVHSAPRSTSR